MLIKAEDVSLGYDSKAIVEHLNFEVNEGDYLCIVGENGSGKSTLMKTVLGLVRPVSGTITFDESFAKKQIGYLPQQTGAQRDFPASVEEIVLSGCLTNGTFHPFYSLEDKALAAENMRRMGLEALRKRSYRTLSGGQQQRVLLARALCSTDRIILMDEPVSGLDPAAAGEMYDAVEELNRGGTAVMMITHDIEGALRYADHILVIGDEVFFGTKEEYMVRAGIVPQEEE